MKKSFLILSILTLSMSCVLAGPHDAKHGKYVNNHKKPPKIHVNYGHSNHHYRHMYRNYGFSHCTCYDPFCIHRHHPRPYYGYGPHFSIGISL